MIRFIRTRPITTAWYSLAIAASLIVHLTFLCGVHHH